MILTETTLQEEIEIMVRDQKLDYLDAVVKFCTDNDLEPEDIKKIISVNLKDKIHKSAIDNNLMKPIPVLPI